MRNAVRENIDNGIVGGERLNKAFSDHLKEENAVLFQQVQPKFLRLVEDVSRTLNGLKSCDFHTETTNFSANFSSKTNIRDYYGRIGGSALGVTGVIVGG